MKLGSIPLFCNGSPRSSIDGDGSAYTPQKRACRIQVAGQLGSILTVIALWPHMALPLQLGVWWLGMTVDRKSVV